MTGTASAPRGIFYSSTTSPFARKVRIAMLLRGIADRFDEVDCDPFQDQPDFLGANPIGQVPAFMTADGEAIFGSALMCAYLDSLGDAPAIASQPAVGWGALQRQAIADGVMECSVRLRAERMLRQPGERSEYWMARWINAINRGLDRLDGSLPDEGVVDVGVVAAFCAALYLDLRHPDLNWRDTRPALAARTTALEGRNAFALTASTVPIAGSTRTKAG